LGAGYSRKENVSARRASRGKGKKGKGRLTIEPPRERGNHQLKKKGGGCLAKNVPKREDCSMTSSIREKEKAELPGGKEVRRKRVVGMDGVDATAEEVCHFQKRGKGGVE